MLAGSTWGAGLIQLRQVYQAVVLPAILYGCSAWHTLKTDSEHRQTRLRTLNQIHTRAMAAITGAFRATATVALNIETHQLPMQCLLEKQALEVLTQIETSQSGDQVRRARRGEAIGSGRIRPGWRPWEWSPLERISKLAMRRLGQPRFQDLECIQLYITAQYWSPPEVIITKNAENAIIEHNTIMAHSQPVTALYTDGSGVNSRVGAAAVCPRHQETRSEYMGEQSEATVYAAELQGILLALVITLRCQIQHAMVFTDNQAALQAIQNPDRQSGQYILETVLAAIDRACTSKLMTSF